MPAKTSVRKLIRNLAERQGAEFATGVARTSKTLGKYYAKGGAELCLQPARAYMVNLGGEVEIPNAGSGDYRAVFESMGFEDVQTICTSSSAGDWSFIARDTISKKWFGCWQESRYPHFGYKYSVKPLNTKALTKAVLLMSQH